MNSIDKNSGSQSKGSHLRHLTLLGTITFAYIVATLVLNVFYRANVICTLVSEYGYLLMYISLTVSGILYTKRDGTYKNAVTASVLWPLLFQLVPIIVMVFVQIKVPRWWSHFAVRYESQRLWPVLLAYFLIVVLPTALVIMLLLRIKVVRKFSISWSTLKRRIVTIMLCITLAVFCMTGWAYIYSLRAYDERESSFNESLEGIAGRVALVNGRNVEISTTDLQGVMVTITFNKKLSLAETWTLIETYHIDTKHMDIVGSATSPALSFSARGETPEGIMSSVSANTNMFKSKFEAFLSMTARIDSKYLGALQRDSNVFLVDPSGDGYFRGHKSISSHERNDIIHSDYPYPRPMTDALEGLNMLR